MVWSGNIEIHVKASEWYTHKHHLDKAYENVILHVVYLDDKEVKIQNEKIPTVELNSYITENELNDIQNFILSKNTIACSEQLNTIDTIFVTKQIETALYQRLKRKSDLIQARYQALGSDLKQVMIEWLALTLGGKTNGLPMIELYKQINFTSLLREHQNDRTNILLYLSGLLPSESLLVKKGKVQHYANKYQLKPMNASVWKFFGVYAFSYPPFRIFQFSHVIAEDRFFHFLSEDIDSWMNWWTKWQFELPDYWKNHTFFSEKEIKHKQAFSKQLKELIVINVIVPFLCWQGFYNHQQDKIEIAFDLLSKLPAERNNIISKWKKLQINVKSAFESQGLLELINEFCNKKKCLSCHIGTKVLQHENNTKDCLIF